MTPQMLCRRHHNLHLALHTVKNFVSFSLFQCKKIAIYDQFKFPIFVHVHLISEVNNVL